jgi:hypothetical protein
MDLEGGENQELAGHLIAYLDASGELRTLAAALADFAASATASVSSSLGPASSNTSFTSADTAAASVDPLCTFKYQPRLNLMQVWSHSCRILYDLYR